VREECGENPRPAVYATRMRVLKALDASQIDQMSVDAQNDKGVGEETACMLVEGVYECDTDVCGYV
jgi:hypothetical protein